MPKLAIWHASTLASWGTLERSWDIGQQRKGRFEVQAWIFIVSASRTPPGLAPKRVHFWSSFWLGSEKGRLLALIFSLGALFGAIFGSCLVYFSVILANFSFLGALWGRWGPFFHFKKTVWTTEGAPR